MTRDTPFLSDADAARRFAAEVARTGPRLARLEFEALQADLLTPGSLSAPQLGLAAPAPGRFLTVAPPPAVPHALTVPLGRIAWVPRPEALPVIAIDIPALNEAEMAAALLRLLSEHHRAPFARFLFLSATPAPLPLLGRYGLAALCRGETPCATVAMAEEARFALSEARSLIDAAVLWRRAPPPAEDLP